MGNDGTAGRVNVRAVVQDSRGQTFLYRLLAPEPTLRTGYPVFKPGFQRVPVRLHAEGLRRPDLGKGIFDTIQASGGTSLPVPPLKLTGLELQADGGAGRAVDAVLSFGEFAWTRLSPESSSLYYALDGKEHFGELDPVPSVALAELGKTSGEAFDVEWELRDAYAGKPILGGRKAYALSSGDPARPYSLQLEQRIEMPVSKPGTYWMTAKLRWSRKPSPVPESIEERTFRLDIVRAAPGAAAPAPPAAVPAPAIAFAPGRDSLVYGAAEPPVLPLVFQPDSVVAGDGASYRVTVRAYSGIKPVRELSGALPPGRPTTVPVDLKDLGEGAWRVRAEVVAGGKVVDAKERLVGKRGLVPEAPAPPPPARPAAAGDPTGGKSLVLLYPQFPDEMRDDAAKRWEAFQAFLEKAPAVTDTIELPIRWKDIEPLPGIIDWTWTDLALDAARARGLKVILAPSLVGMEPDWIPGIFRQNAEKGVFGNQRYLFHGMRPNHWHAAELRASILDLVSAMARRYRSHPARAGYLVLTEHPGDFAPSGWFDGYDPETIDGFRAAVKKEGSGLDAVNKRWGTAFSDWGEIGVPPPSASDRYRLDWLSYRRGAIAALLLDEGAAVRAADPGALLEIYGDGLSERDYPRVRDLGAILANGGTHVPELMGLLRASLGPYGLQERSEENSVGQWQALGATQLDASLFNMMLGGGQNAHIKMFLPTAKSLDDLRKPPYGLDRFERFLPIWRELRAAAAPARDAFVLNNYAARLLKADSTDYLTFGDSSINRSFLESQVIAPLADVPVAVSGRLLFALGTLGTAYEARLDDALAKYVEDGGTLVMTANAGRTSPDRPGEDWILLRRFGWAPPAAPPRNDPRAQARTVAGALFPAGGGAIALQGPAWAGDPAGESAAVFAEGSPAVSWKAFGKGRVVVLWASGLVPPADVPGSVPFLADIARWAGVSPKSGASHPRLYTNLLQGASEAVYYGLAYHSGSHTPWGQDGPALDGARTFWFLPEGRYAVTERVSGKDLGTFTAAQLRDPGLPCDLRQHGVAVYRMERHDDAPSPAKP